jgi:hypothetical protein
MYKFYGDENVRVASCIFLQMLLGMSMTCRKIPFANPFNKESLRVDAQNVAINPYSVHWDPLLLYS